MSENIRILALLCTVFSGFIGYISYRQGVNKSIKEDSRSDATEHTMVATKLDYITRAVDEIRLDFKEQGRKIGDLEIRLAKIEESSKSAHRRIDDLIREGN